MMRMVLVTTLVVGVVACEEHEEPKPSATAQAYAGHPRTLHGNQPPSAAAAPAATVEPRHLAFSIVKVYGKQKPTATGRGHADGGTWEFFDATTSDGAPFTFGYFAPPPSGELPMSFGDCVLATADRARFVTSLAKAFGQALPEAATAAHKGKPLRMRMVVLGRNQKRQAGGSYADGGTATVTKLFFEARGADAEMFFDFDVAQKSGEFAEKDADYDKDVVGISAAEL